MKINVEKVKECKQLYDKAYKLLDEIEKEIKKVLPEDDEFIFREDTFEPFIFNHKEYLASWQTRYGFVYIDKEGNVIYKRRVEK